MLSFISAQAENAELPPRIERLKDLCIETTLVSEQRPQAVIVVPKGEDFRQIGQIIQERIRTLTGVTLPIRTDSLPDQLLDDHNVIAIGNMSNNPFIEKLYRQWYCLLDLKYPGKDGYVVRSLHNPYGTGHNVILVGGSDLKGTETAAKVFANLLEKEMPLTVGWLMKIKLGKGMNPPDISLDDADWKVFSWRDSWRKTRSGREIGYKPSTYFGWNPISIAGVLYYMTGDKKYLDAFKAMAMPDPNQIPAPNLKSDAFNDPLDPLVKNYHYRSHLVDCVWDLIEESPLFTDKERLFITNKLLEHQRHYDPKSTFSKPHGDRHSCWHMMNIYTGSRYFSRYYPDPLWKKRIANVRRAFHTFIGDPTWGERDTLYWVSTSIEPIFDFFTMDGSEDSSEEFVKSGTARTMIHALKVLMTGKERDDYNRYVSISLLNKAGYLLKDGSYYWMARRLGFDFDTFRIGESFWPDEEITIDPPTELINHVASFPLSRTDWTRSQKNVPLEEAFQILSYRTGLGEKDDFFLIDGFNGLGRNPYHLNTIYYLRMFGGKGVLSGYLNDIDIWFKGATDLKVARAAALKSSLVADEGRAVYLKTEVPETSSANWQRHLLYLKDNLFLSIDRVMAKTSGHYDIVASWQFPAKIKYRSESDGILLTRNNIRMAANHPLSVAQDRVAQETVSRPLSPSETVVFANLFGLLQKPKILKELKTGAFIIEGSENALAAIGGFSSEELSTDADFAYVSPGMIILAGARHLTVGDQSIIQATVPVSISWNMAKHILNIKGSQQGEVSVAGIRTGPMAVKKGQTLSKNLEPDAAISASIKNALEKLPNRFARTSLSPPSKTTFENWLPAYSTKTSKGIKITEPAWLGSGNIWAAAPGEKSSTLFLLSSQGKVLKTIERKGEILSLWAAKNIDQASSFDLLIGYRDDTMEAISQNGTTLWRIKAKIDPSFKIGARYDAPWFTDPGPKYKKTGIFSILVDDIWGTGSQQIAIGRPCTVEFRRLDGSLIARVPTKWGDNTALAALKRRGNKPPLLLAGKYFTGFPGLSAINGDYETISDHIFAGLPKGLFSMAAWMQQGLRHLQVADIDGDRIDEVIYTLSGHWNELRVYNGATYKPLWVRYFGPDKPKGGFMRGLEILNNEDGSKTIVVATKRGLVSAFDKDGNRIWQQNLDSSVECIDSDAEHGKILVCLSDGTVLLLDAHGQVLKSFKMDGPVKGSIIEGKAVVFGADGRVEILFTTISPPKNLRVLQVIPLCHSVSIDSRRAKTKSLIATQTKRV